MTNRERIYFLIKRSDLSESEQKELFAFFQFTGDEHLKEIAQLFRFEPDSIRTIYRNLKKKHDAGQSENVGTFRKVLEDEREFIRNLSV